MYVRAILILFMCPTLSWGAITELSTQRATAVECANCDSLALAYPGNVTAGNLLVVGGNATDTSGATGYSITDTVGTTYTIYTCTSLVNTGVTAVPFIAIGLAAGSGANTVTVNPTIDSSAHQIIYGIGEFSGVANPPLDVNGGSATGTSTSPLASITTSAANALILALAGFQSSAAVTPGGSYTQISEDQSNWNAFNLAFRIVTTATAYTADWTLSVSQPWTACAISVAPFTTSSRRPIGPVVLP